MAVLSQWMHSMNEQWPGVAEPLEGEERYKLTLPDRVINLREINGTIELAAELGHCPAAAKEELLQLLLRGNLLGEGTGDAVLAADTAGQSIRLIQRLPSEQPYGEFMQRLEGFVNYADYWAQQVEKYAR